MCRVVFQGEGPRRFLLTEGEVGLRRPASGHLPVCVVCVCRVVFQEGGLRRFLLAEGEVGLRQSSCMPTFRVQSSYCMYRVRKGNIPCV